MYPTAYRVYPRVCGGTRSCFQPRTVSMGLSPRVRGNPIDGELVALHDGSIPACAGEPPYRILPLRRIPVYPRVCGGTCADDSDVGIAYGLSPRVRGNLLQ